MPAVFGNVLRRGKGFRMGDEIVFAGGGDGESREKYLLTGKLYNKIAGLYDFDDNYDEAERYQLLSGEYYLKGNDSVNYIYSLRNIGWLHVLKEEYGEASEYFQNAYRLALPLNDSLLLSSLTNRLGNTYKEMNSYSLAEDYLFKSIAYDEAGSAPTYLALANLFTKKENTIKHVNI